MRSMSRWAEGVFFGLFPDLETERFVIDKKNGKYNLDLWEANRQIMVRAGNTSGKYYSDGFVYPLQS